MEISKKLIPKVCLHQRKGGEGTDLWIQKSRLAEPRKLRFIRFLQTDHLQQDVTFTWQVVVVCHRCVFPVWGFKRLGHTAFLWQFFLGLPFWGTVLRSPPSLDKRRKPEFRFAETPSREACREKPPLGGGGVGVSRDLRAACREGQRGCLLIPALRPRRKVWPPDWCWSRAAEDERPKGVTACEARQWEGDAYLAGSLVGLKR